MEFEDESAEGAHVNLLGGVLEQFADALAMDALVGDDADVAVLEFGVVQDCGHGDATGSECVGIPDESSGIGENPGGGAPAFSACPDFGDRPVRVEHNGGVAAFGVDGFAVLAK